MLQADDTVIFLTEELPEDSQCLYHTRKYRNQIPFSTKRKYLFWGHAMMIELTTMVDHTHILIVIPLQFPLC